MIPEQTAGNGNHYDEPLIVLEQPEGNIAHYDEPPMVPEQPGNNIPYYNEPPMVPEQPEGNIAHYDEPPVYLEIGKILAAHGQQRIPAHPPEQEKNVTFPLTLCRGCMGAAPVMVLVPCGHLAFCDRCYQRNNEVRAKNEARFFNNFIIHVEEYARPTPTCSVCRTAYTTVIL
ncbi:uncharacterized protein [Venturia canescens]|uniref:uncharacterized protein n=1 Tax=Venturia canescens TaxID=32260 RepID=UPI001C9BD523|nr:uncharacterized protein LOC122417726 [Venturia canescens]